MRLTALPVHTLEIRADQSLAVTLHSAYPALFYDTVYTLPFDLEASAVPLQGSELHVFFPEDSSPAEAPADRYNVERTAPTQGGTVLRRIGSRLLKTATNAMCLKASLRGCGIGISQRVFAPLRVPTPQDSPHESRDIQLIFRLDSMLDGALQTFRRIGSATLS